MAKHARTLKDVRQRAVYSALRHTPPRTRLTGLGQAYYYGFDNPTLRPSGPRVGAPSSLARAAWAAGVDNARAQKSYPQVPE